MSAYWRIKDGRVFRITEMSTEHLKNTIRMLMESDRDLDPGLASEEEMQLEIEARETDEALSKINENEGEKR